MPSGDMTSITGVSLGRFTTMPNEPWSLCWIISTTARVKFGSSSWGMASRSPGAISLVRMFAV